MDIRVHKSFKGFFVERLDDRDEWRYWIPKDGEKSFCSGQEALQAAREEWDLEINRACEKMVSNESLEIEI